VSTVFRSVNAETHQLIVREMNKTGYSCVANFLTQEQLTSLQEQVRADAEKT
jgi:hypothetical protein